MRFNRKSLGLATVATIATAIIATATIACSKDPQLNVQNAPQQAPAGSSLPSKATPADPATAGKPAGELPAGHPAVAQPPGHPPAGGMASGMPGGMADAGGIALPPVDPEGGLGAAALVWDVPASWLAEPPANPMRRAQYRIRGAAGDAELVVFYFGPNQGGPPLDNAQRWAMQFAQPDGSDPLAALKTRTTDIRGIPALFVETTGTYNPGTMSGGPTGAKENWALLGVVAQGADANWFFKLTGPKPTVEAERGAFERMIGSLRRGK